MVYVKGTVNRDNTMHDSDNISLTIRADTKKLLLFKIFERLFEGYLIFLKDIIPRPERAIDVRLYT